MIWFIVGFGVGYLFVLLCQCNLEKGYVRTGIAKIFGEYYRITKLGEKELNGDLISRNEMLEYIDAKLGYSSNATREETLLQVRAMIKCMEGETK